MEFGFNGVVVTNIEILAFGNLGEKKIYSV
jgi:hypothetical protein